MGIPVTQWFEEQSISPQVRAQILQRGVTEVIPPEKRGAPLTMVSSDGTHYTVFLIQKGTSKYFIEDHYVRWIEAHLDAIKTDKLPFFIIQDTKPIRFRKTFFELGLTDYMISRSRPTLYSRDALIRKLQQIADRIPELDLPLTIDRICVFGSILREKEKLPDIDVYVHGSRSERQERRSQAIRAALADRNNASTNRIIQILDEESMGERRPIDKLVDEEEDLQAVLTEMDYPLAWFKCLTWSYIEMWASQASITVGLAPNEEIIVRKLLIGNLKGFKDFYINQTLVAQNLVLVWSPAQPNMKENIDNRPESEQRDYLQRELAALLGDTDLFHEKLGEILDERTQKGVAAARPQITRSDGESKEDLIQKIEIMRAYLKRLKYKWPRIHLR